MMDAKQIRGQIEDIRGHLDLADRDNRNQIGHILVALSQLTDIVERLVSEAADRETTRTH